MNPCVSISADALELESALERILAALPGPSREEVSLLDASGRVAFEAVLSPMDLPPFDNSAMDGFAVRAEETVSTSASQPALLRNRGILAAGKTSSEELKAGECLRLFTGAPLPPGANAVVMQEDTRRDPSDAEAIFILESVTPWENVRFRGEDVKKGQRLCEAGQRLGAGQLALLAATGHDLVAVGKLPAITIMATGSELREAGMQLSPGQIYESNRVAIKGLIQATGSEPRLSPIVPDNGDATRTALADAFAHSDIVVSCGGVSVGEFDFVKKAFEDLGGHLDFWRVNIRPGRPFVFGRLGNRFLFGLPGNPVSALVTFLLLARPALLRWQGAADCGLSQSFGTLAQAIHNDTDRRHFVRVRIDEKGLVHTTGTQASHILSSLALANGLLDLRPQSKLLPGENAPVLRF